MVNRKYQPEGKDRIAPTNGKLTPNIHVKAKRLDRFEKYAKF